MAPRNSFSDRRNRRGCLIIVIALILLIAALAYIGFNGDPIDAFKSSIPVQN